MLVEDEKPPPAFLCPIMGDIMRDPCSCTDGHSYERQSIAKWLEEHETSPVTGAPLPSKVLIPNHPNVSSKGPVRSSPKRSQHMLVRSGQSGPKQ